MRKAGWVLLYMALLAMPADAVNMNFTTVFSVPMASFNIVETTSSDKVSLCLESGLKYNAEGNVTGTLGGCDGIVQVGFTPIGNNFRGGGGRVNLRRKMSTTELSPVGDNATLSIGRDGEDYTAWQTNKLTIGNEADVTVSSLIVSKIIVPSNSLTITANALDVRGDTYVKTLKVVSDGDAPGEVSLQIGVPDTAGKYQFAGDNRASLGVAGKSVNWFAPDGSPSLKCLKYEL
ncbi:MAG: hypothetical protein J6Y25_06335 [Elusimicrobiaceae bacterium]|nr:hypothetical protein [Elusimicrobiaceae bacterium]